MDQGLKKTLAGLFILSLVIYLIGITLFKSLLADYTFGFFPFLILIFLLVNTGFFIFFHRSLLKPHNQFIRNFMISTGIKLLLYVILILGYVFISPKTAVSFAITLFIVYLIYTAYDLLVMLSLLKQKK